MGNALSSIDPQALVEAARAIRKNAYCPYSNFAVGSALLDTDGGVHLGVNVENAAYPVGLCSERVALGNAVTTGVTSFVAIALVTAAPNPVAPCGMCRQALLEFAPDLTLYLAAPEGDWIETRLSDIHRMQLDPVVVTNAKKQSSSD